MRQTPIDPRRDRRLHANADYGRVDLAQHDTVCPGKAVAVPAGGELVLPRFLDLIVIGGPLFAVQ